MIASLLSTVAEGQPGVVTTAVVAAASAILGATAGGFASFQANVALDNRRRRARAAIRRKAKVYTPVRAESIALSRAMEKDEHLQWGVDIEERNPEWPQRGPTWRLWPALKEDGRAATAASKKIIDALDHVETSIEHFEETRHEAFTLMDEVGRRVYEEVVGEPLTMANAWDSGTALLEVYRDVDDEVWYPFTRTNGEARFPELRESFNRDSQIRQMRTSLAESDSHLQSALSAAISDLEAGIASIARRHELEGIED